MAERMRTSFGTVFVLALATGCGSEDSESPKPQGCENSLTPYDGDCLRLAAPAPDEGMQLHYGPSSYTEQDMAPYLIQPGEEIVDILYLKTPNDQGMYFNAVETQLRPFGHHLIVGQSDRDFTDGLYKADLPPVDFDILIGATAQALDASPESRVVAPENEG